MTFDAKLIQPGDRIPSASLFTSQNPDAEGVCAVPSKVETTDFFAGRKIVLVTVPAAFSPTCQEQHIPAFVDAAQDLKNKGVDVVAVLSADTVFAVDAWGKAMKTGKAVTMLSDPYVEFSQKLGLAFETRAGLGPTGFKMGDRTRRAALIVEDGVVKWIGVDEKGLDVSSAQSVLAHLIRTLVNSDANAALSVSQSACDNSAASGGGFRVIIAREFI
ncbi:hypothetical protein HDU86_003632 [Geranomyces michiganensis]|nr:hypothetical protein HDU86_003632 [Geranomyces michiganensis]